MQQLILLLTSFLLACGFPAFLIGFYSIRIWESRLRFLSISSVSSDSYGRDTSKSNHRKQKDKERCQEKADRLARETVPERKLSVSASHFSSCKKIGTQWQPTDLLLQQLMAEIKYLRKRVDTLPTGPAQEVAASLQTSPEVPEPSSQTFSSFEEMEVTEQTALPYLKPLSLLDFWRLAPLWQTLRFPRWRIFDADPETCWSWGLPPTAGAPLLEPSQIFIIWCSGSAKAERSSSFHQGFCGSPAFPVHLRLLQITLQYSRWFSDVVSRAPTLVHRHVGLLRPWCVDNPWQAVYTQPASCG
jgi:hypothetical protein